MEEKKNQPRIFEFLQGANKLFSNKRLLALMYGLASIGYAFKATPDVYILGALIFAATGNSAAGLFEKKLQ
jgi:hypothetical protein